MNLSTDARRRLVAINLCIWALAGVLALVLLSGPGGLIATHIEPIGRELGGWPRLLIAAAGFDREPIAGVEIHVEPRADAAARLLPAPGGPRDTPWFRGEVRVDGVAQTAWLQEVAPRADEPLEARAWRIRFEREVGPLAGEVLLAPQQPGIHVREAALRDVARALGLLAPKAGFASVRINDGPAARYFWSQRDPGVMLTQLGYPSGSVVQPDRFRHGSSTQHSVTVRHSVARFRPPPEVDRAPGADAAGERQLERLIELVDRATDEEFDHRVAELLDVRKFLCWNALAWVLGSPEARPYDTLAWYLDPVTGLLEPIVQDWTRRGETALDATGDASRLSARLLRNPSNRAVRNRQLWDWVTEGHTDLIADSERRIGESLVRLARAQISLFGVSPLAEEAREHRRIRESQSDRRAQILAALRAAEIRVRSVPRPSGASQSLAVELEPRGMAEVELMELRLELEAARGRRALPPTTVRLVDPAGTERRLVTLKPEIAGSAVRMRPAGFGMVGSDAGPWRLEIDLPLVAPNGDGVGERLALLELSFRNAVTGELLPPARLVDAPDPIAEIVRPVREAIRRSGLPLVVESDTLVLRPGSHHLARTLVVPPEFRLRLEPGVHLRLDPGVGIVTFRGLTAIGTPFAPIEIRPADPQQAWGAIGVVRAPERSLLDYVSISGGSKLHFDGVKFGGQLSFNASDFSLDHAEVSRSVADGLAAKRSDFAIRRSGFFDNAHDGVESEWSTGSVEEAQFFDNGDDGLDLADTRITVADCHFGGMSDKAISADTGSVVTVARTQLDQSGIAIASKNGSRVDALEAVFRNNRLGFAVYRDKPLSDGGLGIVVGGSFENNERDFSIEPGSELELVDINRIPAPSYRTAWSVRGPVVLRVADNQSSMLYSSTPSKGKKRY